MPEDGERAAELLVRIKQDDRLPRGCKKIKYCMLKNGPRTFKTASLYSFGQEASDEVTHNELRVRTWTWKKKDTDPEESSSSNWSLDDLEIDKLCAFLSEETEEPGKYRRMAPGSPAETLTKAIESGVASSSDIMQVVAALLSRPDSVSTIASSSPAVLLAGTVHLTRHTQTLDRLETLLADPASTESDVQKVLAEDWWIFGGRYINRSQRRSLTVLDEIDVPLIRSDGVLHIVELKSPNCPRLVIEHRNHHIAGQEVNVGVGQVANYLRSLDEQRDIILNTLGIDCRRAFATVVIGHPQWVADIDSGVVNEAIRTYNSHLARIEVITYADLLADSRNAVNIQLDEPRK